MLINGHSLPEVFGHKAETVWSSTERSTDTLRTDSSSHRNLHQFPLSDPASLSQPHLAPSNSHTYQIKHPPPPSPLHPGQQGGKRLFCYRKIPSRKMSDLSFIPVSGSLCFSLPHSHLSYYYTTDLLPNFHLPFTQHYIIHTSPLGHLKGSG